MTVFVPVHDTNPLTSIKFQFVTVGLIAANIIVFLLSKTTGIAQIAGSFAIVPVELFDEGLFGSATIDHRFDMVPIAERWTLITYMFLHGDFFHILGNMLFLWVFGDNVEDALGHVRFLIFYLACGVAGGLAHSWLQPASGVPLIGASGAVAGVVAAYLMLHPKVRVWVLVMRFIPLQISAFWVLGAWILMQFAMVFIPSVGPVAWWAHIGGIVAGAVLVIFMKRPDVALFDQSTTGA